MKKRFFQTCIALFAVIFVLGFVSCDGDGGGGGGGGKKGDATLTALKFGAETATLGTPAATLAGVTAKGAVLLLSSTVASVTPTKSADAAVVSYWTDTGSGGAPDWYPAADTDFVTGDTLCIRVVNGGTTLYYKIVVTIATKTTITAFTIDGVAAPRIGDPGASWNTAESVSVLLTKKVSEQGAGLTVTATTYETAATATFGHAVGTADPTATFAATIPALADGEFVYVKVVFGSGATQETGYYKFAINFVQEGRIKYGSPAINAQTLDAMWDQAELQVYPITKIYPNDSASYIADQAKPEADRDYPTTTGWAKALWDEEGLTVLVEVTDGDVSEVDAAHESDSFELFVNEALSEATNNKSYTNGGSQYRVGANGSRSGEGSSPAALEALNKTAAFKTATGYRIIMKAPWRLRSKFFSSTTYRDGWKVGFELQLNIAPATGTRYGVLVWNNISHTNYQNANDYGEATLYGAPATLNYPALAPTITTQPRGGTFNEGESVSLSVVATTLDTGTLSYQWYSGDTNKVEDATTISGATNATYSTTAGATSKYYSVVVTNTMGGTTATTRSAIAAIIAGGGELPAFWKDKVTMTNTAVPVYGFNLPNGKKLGDYTKVKLEMQMEEASISGRLRVWGNYVWPDLGSKPGMGNAADSLLISSTDGGSTFTNEWTVYERTFNNINAALGCDQNATGVILLGIGPVPAAGGSGTKTYYVRNITLENADGTAVVKALHPASPLLWGGAGAEAFVNQAGTDSVVRVASETDFVLNFNPPVGNTEAKGQYNSLAVIDLGEDFDIMKYEKFTFEFKIYEADGTTEITAANGQIQMKWRDKDNAHCAGAGASWRFDLGNMGDGLATNTDKEIPAWLKEIGEMHDVTQATQPTSPAGDVWGPTTALRKLDFENASTTPTIIKITRITFFLP